MVDVVIAGGGVAGSALAILLGRAGFAVELFERDVFPREKPCGEGMMPAGVSVLERLGVASQAGGEPFHGVRYHFGPTPTEATFPQAKGFPSCGRGLRRKHLDRLLFETAAGTVGVTAYSGARVDSPLYENGRVTGIAVDGEPKRSRLVVAADGAHSRFRYHLGFNARSRAKRMGIRMHYRLASGQEPSGWVDVLLRPGYELYVTPLPDHEVLIAALTDIRQRDGPIRRTFQRWISAEPFLMALLEGASRISEPACASWPSKCTTRTIQPGLVLLGDAAGLIDPVSGGGMTHALLTAELLAQHITRGDQKSDDWIASFERERRRQLIDFARVTRVLLGLARYPWMAARILTVAAKFPFILSHLAGVAAGTRCLSGNAICRGIPP